jgi:hypothetical protein
MPLRSCRELSLQVVDPVSDMPPSELLPTVERIPYQNMTITYQELIDAIENLPIEEQESLQGERTKMGYVAIDKN